MYIYACKIEICVHPKDVENTNLFFGHKKLQYSAFKIGP